MRMDDGTFMWELTSGCVNAAEQGSGEMLLEIHTWKSRADGLSLWGIRWTGHLPWLSPQALTHRAPLKAGSSHGQGTPSS